ncbi:hypothetical protein B0T19DRAFT_402300 [Cercophora scortea]|uniref:Uncharacterized protein n=1 Tax=Cercophora scortea TaxID=314031 RepID=A0AAE0IF40_9PEZI|nr:hypothetical protein B0T19DRAFT_402300 [Cercophora scortea]
MPTPASTSTQQVLDGTKTSSTSSSASVSETKSLSTSASASLVTGAFETTAFFNGTVTAVTYTAAVSPGFTISATTTTEVLNTVVTIPITPAPATITVNGAPTVVDRSPAFVTETVDQTVTNTLSELVVGRFVSFVGAPTIEIPTPDSNTPFTFTVAGNAAPPPAPTPSSTSGTTQTSSSSTGGPSGTAAPQDISTGGTNGGLVAGVAIGCLVAGLLLGLAAAFLFFKKRSQKQNHDGFATAEPKFASAPPPPLPDQNGIQLDRFLLDASPDKEIASELHSLSILIQQHVENNYVQHHIQANPHTLVQSLAQLGFSQSGTLTPEAIAALALEPRTRQVALQHVISQVVFTSVDVSARSRLSMLPAPIAAFLQSIPPAESGKSNAEASSLALNKWRVLSAFLLHPSRSQRTTLPPSDAAIVPQAASLAGALDTFLAAFAPGDDNGRYQQNNHLQQVIIEATKLGYVLLSQPSEWQFIHVPIQQQHGGRVAVAHNAGPQQVVAPTLVQI